MVRNITEPSVRFDWVENRVGPEAVVEEFVCTCGNVCIEECTDKDDDVAYVTTHGCGRDEHEYIECDECGTKWYAVWKGMEFERQ